MMKSTVIFLVLLSWVSGQSTNVQQCLYQGGADTLPINTYIVGCASPPCSFAQETTVELQIIFRARRQIQQMQTLAYAYIFGPIGVPYDLGEEAVTCNFFTNTYCPLLEGEVVQYTLRMHIEAWMPSGTSTTIEFVIRDSADNTPVTCMRLPIIITPPIQNSLDTLKNTTNFNI